MSRPEVTWLRGDCAFKILCGRPPRPIRSYIHLQAGSYRVLALTTKGTKDAHQDKEAIDSCIATKSNPQCGHQIPRRVHRISVHHRESRRADQSGRLRAGKTAHSTQCVFLAPSCSSFDRRRASREHDEAELCATSRVMTRMRSSSGDQRRSVGTEYFWGMCHALRNNSIDLREGNLCSGPRSTNLPRHHAFPETTGGSP